MNTGNLSEITDLRGIWPRGAESFTTWLQKEEHLKLLSDALGINIGYLSIETGMDGKETGLSGLEKKSRKMVVIESQFEQNESGHLESLISHAAAKEAYYIIWIVRNASQKQKNMIRWLNQHTDNRQTEFFLCELKVFVKSSARLVIHFNVFELQDQRKKENSSIVYLSTHSSETDPKQANIDYWNAFMNYAARHEAFHSKFQMKYASRTQHFSISMSDFPGKLVLRVSFINSNISIELDTDWKEHQYLLKYRQLLDLELGTLSWISKDKDKVCKIIKKKDIDPNDPTTRQAQFKWFVEQSVKFQDTLEMLNVLNQF